ncbi:CD109 antigen-like [Haliotis asinina]|uniref:CD109 antigen-like n=1 Tax=Haliotis asinina TaxID=109174 RepID=UPI003531B877
MTIKVPNDIPSGSYRLHVAGRGGLTFDGVTWLTYKSKNMSVFIQTDKATYKPGQTVHFRAFSLFPDMKLYTGAMDISILDSNSNKIKQWVGLKAASGVITNYLPISTEPVLGDWKIKVTAGRTAAEKVFTVAEYVLPKFEVKVELPPYVLVADDGISVNVKARYTYDKPVKGTLSLVAKLEKYYRPWNYHGEEPKVMKTLATDGESRVTLSLADIKKVFPYGLRNREIRVTADVTDSLTGIALNGTTKVKVYQDATKLSFSPSDPKTFKPGLKYIAYLQVQQQDGRPVWSNTQLVSVTTRVTVKNKQTVMNKVTVSNALRRLTTPPPPTNEYYGYGYYPRTSSYTLSVQTFSVPHTGLVPIEVQIPASAVGATLTVKYGQVYTSKSITKSYSPSDNYIQLLLKSQKLTAGGIANFDVNVTEPISGLAYQVLSRGSIVDTGTIRGQRNCKLTSFSIPVTSKMAPNSRIIVYYVRADGELVADSVSFDVDGVFENKVSISMDKTSAQPGDSVNVQVTADPQSLVNLLAADQSVLLLKSGNDITQSEVISELKSYDTINDVGGGYVGRIPLGAVNRRKRMAYWEFPIYYGGSDVRQIFQNSGVAVITDALVYRYVPPINYYGPVLMSTSGPLLMATAGTTVSSPRSRNLAEVERTRVYFPETWLWTNTTTCNDYTAAISATVPDTITSWVVSAFAVNVVSGLGVAPNSAKIRVFRPFFVSLNLPYSVTRGEQLAVQAIVFNYLGQDVDVVVSLPESEDYLNIVIDANGNERTERKNQTQTVSVKANVPFPVYFPIIPVTLGYIDLKVSARSTLAADAIKRQLLVKPEGTPKEFSVPILIDLNEATSFSKTVPITLPENVVAGSQTTRVTAIGDLMGPTVSGLDSLLRMPTGCGEQTMLSLAPDVFIINYLTATNQLTGDIEDKAIKYMESGYQNELKYQHRDGSFSAFGDKDPSGSMWLTAFVVKTFHQAKPFILVDDTVLTRAINWMVTKQNTDGSFQEPGRVIHKGMAGGSNKGAALTAYVLVALLENDDLTRSVQQSINGAKANAVQFLENQTPTDDYSLAIITYALQLAGSNKADSSFATLNSHVVVKDGFKYWHRPEVKTTQSTYSYWKPPSAKKAIDIEMTAYGLLTYGERENYSGGLNIMKWLVSQRNPHGGFISTQDTVIALFALSEFAKPFSNDFDIQVTVNSGSFNHKFSINQDNALVLQSVELSPDPCSISVQAKGAGFALVEIAVFFNVEAEVEEPSFDVNVKILKEDINSITVQTCTMWLLNGTSGMAIQELGIPSGFEADLDTLTKLNTLKRIEPENRKVVLYFDEIGTTPVCLSVTLQRTGLVAKSQPVPVRVYDYYEPTNQVTAFYQSKLLKKSSIFNVCVECDRGLVSSHWTSSTAAEIIE